MSSKLIKTVEQRIQIGDQQKPLNTSSRSASLAHSAQGLAWLAQDFGQGRPPLTSHLRARHAAAVGCRSRPGGQCHDDCRAARAGLLNRREIAALVGVAPMANDPAAARAAAPGAGASRSAACCTWQRSRPPATTRPSGLLRASEGRWQVARRPGRLHAQVAHHAQRHGAHWKTLGQVASLRLTSKTVTQSISTLR